MPRDTASAADRARLLYWEGQKQRRMDTAAAFRSETLNGEPASLIASARNFKTDPLKTTGRMNRIRVEEWHKAAWEFFDTVPEYHYSVTVVANMLSRAKLVVLKDGKPTKDAKALAALAALGGGPKGQTELLRQYGIHFTVAGDSYLIGMERQGKPDWFVAAASEIRAAEDGVWKVGEEELAVDDLVIRAWRPHPQKRHLPDSPTRAALPILAEIDGLTKHVSAQIDSRLAGAGILFISEDMNIGKAPRSVTTIGEVPTVEDVVDLPELNPASELMEELIETMAASLEDRSSASALVPIVVQVKGDTIKDIKHITFWSGLDENAKGLRAEAISRLALGMDMPPETLMGTSDSNHWNAWQSEEAGIKSHAEPLLFAITDALTDGYLRPALAADGIAVEDLAAYTIGADTTEMRLRPNRSKEALELYHEGVLSAETVIRENGFDPESDVMGDDERKLWYLSRVASGSTTPELVAQALIAFGVPGISVPADTGNVSEARPQRSLEGHPVRELPEEDDSDAVAASLVAPAFMMVDRALERAGNRIRNRMGGARVKNETGGDVSAVDTYRFVRIDFKEGLLDYLLDDAWSHCERFAATFDVDGDWLHNALDTYARDLLQFSKPNEAEALRNHLALTLRTRPERLAK